MVALRSKPAIRAAALPLLLPFLAAIGCAEIAGRTPSVTTAPPGFSADTFTRDGLISGATATEAGCRALPDGLWVNARDRRECLRFGVSGMQGPAAHRAGLRPRRSGWRVLPLRGRQALCRARQRALRTLARNAGLRSGGAERGHGRHAGGPHGEARHARLLRQPRARPPHRGRGRVDGQRADRAAAALRIPRFRALRLFLRRPRGGEPPGAAERHSLRGDRLRAA